MIQIDSKKRGVTMRMTVRPPLAVRMTGATPGDCTIETWRSVGVGESELEEFGSAIVSDLGQEE